MPSLILNKMSISFLFLATLASSCLAMDYDEDDFKKEEQSPKIAIEEEQSPEIAIELVSQTSPSPSLFNLQSVVTEIYVSAKTCSDQDSSINLANVCYTLNLFTLGNTKVIFDHIMDTFFTHTSPFEGLKLINVHTLKNAEKTLKINLYKRVITISNMSFKNVPLDIINELATLKRLLPNYKNIEKQASKKMLSDSKILKAMEGINELNITTIHLENVIKQLHSFGKDLTLDVVRLRFLEHLDAPLLSLVNIYQCAKRENMLPNFFLNGFSNGCKIVRLSALQDWSFKYIYHMDSENEYLRKAKENAQFKNTTEFNYKNLNARIIYLAYYICQLKSIEFLMFADASKSKLLKLAKNVFESLTEVEQEVLEVKESGEGFSYVLMCLNNFLDDFRDVGNPKDSIHTTSSH